MVHFDYERTQLQTCVRKGCQRIEFATKKKTTILSHDYLIVQVLFSKKLIGETELSQFGSDHLGKRIDPH